MESAVEPLEIMPAAPAAAQVNGRQLQASTSALQARNCRIVCAVSVIGAVLGIGVFHRTWHADGKGIVFPWKQGTLEGEQCTSLTDHGSYFSVELSVGSPAQKFDVVLDTGSNAVIIPSCVCQEMDYGCPQGEQCFRGTNHSSTFSLEKPINPDSESKVVIISMTFGSGTIQAVEAQDIIRIGKVTEEARRDLLLLVDRRELEVTGPFGGILGLGVPHNYDGSLGIPLFPQVAGVNRFSVCFSDTNPGTVKWGVPAFERPLTSAGGGHWSLEFKGVTLGSSTVPLNFCSAASAPCLAIPDSGTTLLMGPAKHVTELLASLCGAWPRCQKAAAANTATSKDEHFKQVLLGCEDWFTADQGIDEIPSINLLVAGTNGEQRTLSLTSWAYIFETIDNDMSVEEKLAGHVPVRALSSSRRVCQPAIAASDFEVDSLGRQSWLFGMPLFYQYTVGYDLGSSAPAMSFSDGPCADCGAGGGFLSHEDRAGERSRALRRIDGPLRHPGNAHGHREKIVEKPLDVRSV